MRHLDAPASNSKITAVFIDTSPEFNAVPSACTITFAANPLALRVGLDTVLLNCGNVASIMPSEYAVMIGDAVTCMALTGPVSCPKCQNDACDGDPTES